MTTIRQAIEPYVILVKNLTKNTSIPPELILAIIYQESRGQMGAVRYEPDYRWTYQPATYAEKLGITLQTEEMAQKFSYGLTQLMLATARWLGFDGYPLELYQPTGNVSWCIAYLQRLQLQYSSLPDIISAYNAGTPRKNVAGLYSNQDYVDNVVKYLNYIRTSGVLDGLGTL